MATVKLKRDERHDLIVCDVYGEPSLRKLVYAIDGAVDLGVSDLWLWIVAHADLSGLSFSQLELCVLHLLEGTRAPRRIAVLDERGKAPGWAAVIAAIAAERGFGQRVHAFVDRDRAMEWLGIRELPTSPLPYSRPASAA